MSLLNTSGKSIASASVALKVIRANGDVEDLGVVSYYNSNPFVMWKWKISQWLRGMTAGRISGAKQ